MYSSEVVALINEHGYVEAFKIYQERRREREALQGENADEMPWDELKRRRERENTQKNT